jgi:hypothetical protein
MRKNVLLAVLACVLALGAYPASASALVKAFWGPDQINGQSAFPIYQDLGVGVFQQILSWSDIATSRPANPTDPNDPAYNWPPQIDYDIQQAEAHNIQVLLMPMNTPPWANGGQPPRLTPTDPTDYANFVTAAAKRYPQVKHWMIWGEPCSARNYQPITIQPIGKPLTPAQKLQPQSYAVLLDDAYGALKAVSPSNIVIGGDSWSVCDIRPLEWVKYLKLPDGRRPRMDLYGHNPFTFFSKRATPPRYGIMDFPALPRLQAAINRYLEPATGKAIHLWLSEFTLPTGRDTEFNFHYSEARQAQLIRSTFAEARRLHTASYGWIFLEDTPAGNPPDDRHRGGLLRADGSKKPGYAVFKREH